MRLHPVHVCVPLLVAAVSLPRPVPAAEPWSDPGALEKLPEPAGPVYAYLKTRLSTCVGDGQALPQPLEISMGGRTWRFDGPTLRQSTPDPDGKVTLGLLGAIKEFNAPTRRALTFFLDRFAKSGVDAVLLLGDVASTEFEQTQILLFLAQRGWPVMSVIGNTEGRSAFNRAHLLALKASPHIVNLDITRRVELPGATLITQPGYHDRRFIHQSAACSYSAEDVRALSKLAEGAAGSLVLVAHGPPAGKGRNALDLAVEGGNVGDPALATWIREKEISFGVFSHILEAGGRAVDEKGASVPAGKPVKRLFLNAGSANPLSWQLNGGGVSCGMGMILQIQDGRGSYTRLDAPCPKPGEPEPEEPASGGTDSEDDE